MYVKGAIEQSLKRIFGEIGGFTTVDLLKFDATRKRLIIRIPHTFYVKLRTALTLIDTFQETACCFHVNAVSSCLLALVDTF